MPERTAHKQVFESVAIHVASGQFRALLGELMGQQRLLIVVQIRLLLMRKVQAGRPSLRP